MNEKRNSSLSGQITIFFVICCLVMGSFVVNAAVALDGSGTQEHPWRIKSLEDFNDFAADANYWDDYTRLETDVNLAGQIYTTAVIAPDINNTKAWFQGTAFTGVFDGNDHKIMNLTIDDGGVRNEFLGLFGYIDNGEVGNLGVEGNSVSGNSLVGGLVGGNDGNILNCYSTGSVRGNWFNVGGLVGWNGIYGSISNCYSTGDANGAFGDVGGLVGFNENGNVSNCYSTGDVSGEGEVGGLMGRNNEGNVSNCYSTGSVSGGGALGGLVGRNYSGSISNCYSTSSVSGGVWEIGGLVGGNMDSSVSYCYSTGNVSGENEVGGLVGRAGLDSNISNCYSNSSVSGGVRLTGGLVGGNWKGSISNCYSSGDVNGVDTVGGLVGWNGGGSVSNCYSTGDVSGRNEVGGLMGMSLDNVFNCFWDTDAQTHGVTESIGDPGGTVINVLGLPTTEMHQQSTFTNWDFINIWNIGANQTYPYIRVYLPSDINKDRIVNFLDFAITANQWMEQQ